MFHKFLLSIIFVFAIGVSSQPEGLRRRIRPSSLENLTEEGKISARSSPVNLKTRSNDSDLESGDSLSSKDKSLPRSPYSLPRATENSMVRPGSPKFDFSEINAAASYMDKDLVLLGIVALLVSGIVYYYSH